MTKQANQQERAMQQQIRQGDVLLVPIKSIPVTATIDAKDANGRVVLAYGEVTGHAHVLDAPAKSVGYRMDTAGKHFVELVKDTALRHEEHAAIHVVQGKYQQGFQVEDFGQEIRRVAD